MMTDIDWTIPAKLLERKDGGSDLYFEFTELAEGGLADLISRVMTMDAPARARVVIDAGAMGTLNMVDIVGLTQRDDYPA